MPDEPLCGWCGNCPTCWAENERADAEHPVGATAAMDERPDPTVPPISWCRIFQVGPACPKLCADCAATYRRKREMERAR